MEHRYSYTPRMCRCSGVDGARPIAAQLGRSRAAITHPALHGGPYIDPKSGKKKLWAALFRSGGWPSMLRSMLSASQHLQVDRLAAKQMTSALVPGAIDQLFRLVHQLAQRPL